jgi:ubiquinone biosynthesis protein
LLVTDWRITMDWMTALLWTLFGISAMASVTFLGGRLLGARRSIAALVISGVVGWASAVAIAGAMTEWEWDTLNMVLVAFALGTIFTMAVALALDLIAPVGSLARGAEAELIPIGNPITAIRRSAAPFRRYRQVLRIAREQGVLSLDVTSKQLPSRMRKTLEAAGGIFVKLGQVASTRPDVLPLSWCVELSHLRSGA